MTTALGQPCGGRGAWYCSLRGPPGLFLATFFLACYWFQIHSVDLVKHLCTLTTLFPDTNQRDAGFKSCFGSLSQCLFTWNIWLCSSHTAASEWQRCKWCHIHRVNNPHTSGAGEPLCSLWSLEAGRKWGMTCWKVSKAAGVTWSFNNQPPESHSIQPCKLGCC